MRTRKKFGTWLIVEGTLVQAEGRLLWSEDTIGGFFHGLFLYVLVNPLNSTFYGTLFLFLCYPRTTQCETPAAVGFIYEDYTSKT